MTIVDQLHGRVSPRFIRECLEEKYKQKVRVDNAKKQQQDHHKEPASLAALPPLTTVVDTDKITILDMDEPMPIAENDDVDESYTTTIDASAADITIAESPYQPQEQQIKKQINNNPNDIEECPNCKDLHSRNLELEEALGKSSQMITADKMGSISTEDNYNEILNFEFFIPYGELQKNVASMLYKTSSLEVWFCGKINKNSGKVISSSFGKLSQQSQ
jgi:hypothetical protein